MMQTHSPRNGCKISCVTDTENIFTVLVCDWNNVLRFRNMAPTIISNERYADRNNSLDKESQRIVTATYHQAS